MFSREGVDASDINPATATLRGMPPATWILSVRQDSHGQFDCRVKDVNNDGLPDLVCKFDLTGGTLSPGEQPGIVEATTFGGYNFRGSDTIRLVQ